MSTEKVVAFDALERLATGIKSDLVNARKSRDDWIEFTIAAAVKIADARARLKNDKAFGEWWDAQGFALNDHERAALADMGKQPDIMREVFVKTDRRSIRLIFDENQSRFGNAAKPPRAQRGRGKRGTSMPVLERARAAVRPLLDANAPIDTRALGKEIGVSHVKIDEAIAAETAARQARAEAETPIIDAKTLSMSAQQKLDAVIRQEKKRLEAENREYLLKEIDGHIRRLKTEQFPRWKEDADNAAKWARHYEKLINDHKPVFTDAEFMSIWRCLHADSRNSISEARLNAAFNLFNAKRLQLTKTQ